MKRIKIAGAASAILATAMLLSACGGTGGNTSSEAPTSFTYVYAGADPTTFDYVQTNRTTNSDIFSNFEDGLMENDPDGNLIGDLAKSWSVSADQLTYTFNIRPGVKWVSADGSEYADVKPSDFVTGLKHAVDSQSDMLYLVQGLIKGLDDYVSGTTKDFSTVGVVADDEAGTVKYTLNNPAPYFVSLTAYSILFPINSDFLESKGEDYGSVSGPDNILYNGPFTLANFTSKSVIELTANDSYWDKANVHIKDVKLNYYDGAQPSLLFTQFDKGTYTMGRVYPNDSSWSQVQAKYKDDVNFSIPGQLTYNFTWNLDRQAYKLTSKTSDKQKSDTKAAILNRDFRAAVTFAFNKEDYNAQIVGEDGALAALRNTLVPTDFVNIAGKPYGDTVKADLVDLDSSVWQDVDINGGNNSTFNADTAKAEFAKAKTALQAQGVTFPIHVDLPQDSSSTMLVNEAKSFKQSVESTLGADNLVIDLQMTDTDTYNSVTYLATSGDQSDYDISSASGWGPDYTDPATYLNIYDSRSGDMLQSIGLIGTASQEPSTSMANAITTTGLDQYDQLLDDAAKITDVSQSDDRYTAYAKAEAFLLNSFIQIPAISDGGTPSLSRMVPFTQASGKTGIMNFSNTRYKFLKLQNDVVTSEQYDKAKKGYEERNAKATVKDEVKE